MSSTRQAPQVYGANIAATTPAPTLVSQGLPYSGKTANSETVFLVSRDAGGAATDNITLVVWWWDPLVSRWVQDTRTTVITDTGVLEAYLIGTRIYVQVTAITVTGPGTFDITSQPLDKGN